MPNHAGQGWTFDLFLLFFRGYEKNGAQRQTRWAREGYRGRGRTTWRATSRTIETSDHHARLPAGFGAILERGSCPRVHSSGRAWIREAGLGLRGEARAWAPGGTFWLAALWPRSLRPGNIELRPSAPDIETQSPNRIVSEQAVGTAARYRRDHHLCSWHKAESSDSRPRRSCEPV